MPIIAQVGILCVAKGQLVDQVRLYQMKVKRMHLA